jgi:hypothetical protein
MKYSLIASSRMNLRRKKGDFICKKVLKGGLPLLLLLLQQKNSMAVHVLILLIMLL